MEKTNIAYSSNIYLLCILKAFQPVCIRAVIFLFTDWFKAVRATSILGFISLLVSIVMILLKNVCRERHEASLVCGNRSCFRWW